MKRFAALLVLGPLLLLSAGGLALLSWLSTAPSLGPIAGRLQPCPTTANCVCSEDPAEPSHLDPILCTGSATPMTELARLKQLVFARPRMRLLEEGSGYLRFEATSALFRFKDDLEFLADDSAKVIHVRSGSRVGQSDLGTNRRRVEAIRQQFMATAPTSRP